MSWEALKGRLHGAFAFPVTPFKADDWMELDEEGLRANIKFLVKNGVRKMVPCAGTGELPSLTEEEHRRAVKTVAETAGKDALVAPGIPGSTKQALQAARFFEELGLEAVLAFPPAGREAGIQLHYETLAQSVHLGLIVYNTQGWTPQFIAQLSRIPTVVALKDEMSELRSFARTARLVGDRIVLIGGVDHGAAVAPQYFTAGMKGFTCGLINFAPKYELGIYEAAVRKDYDRVVQLQQTLAPLAEFRSKVGSVSVVKAAMDMVGLAGGPPRPPHVKLTEEERKELKRLLADLGLQV
ncbi:MAG: dihydrodipicolinate synthase family protein [Candidatus Bathyarchaeia archaeon]